MDEEKGRKGRVLCKSLKSMGKEEHLTGIRVGRNRMSGKGPIKNIAFLQNVDQTRLYGQPLISFFLFLLT